MNKHFEDTRYYAKRSVQAVRAGVDEELEPVRERVATVVRSEDGEEPAPSRFDDIRRRARARFDRSRESIGSTGENVRSRIDSYRRRRAAE